ncbi:carbohydrate-binding protein [Micromonospora rubida]|uniref:carbohydrate-binding protein n=1 Tax=Micromonospora rubida TaxID=2697657 RepID=UPI002E2D1C52|nr:carbohydrate-binding protein [Micromonospora rubida]
MRVATGAGFGITDALSLRDAANNVLATVSVPDTGGWATYQSAHATVDLPAGDQVVTLYCETRGLQPRLPPARAPGADSRIVSRI